MPTLIKCLLLLVSVFSWMFGVHSMYIAETVTNSAMHQIIGLLGVLIGVTSMGFVGLMEQRS